jgi:hypothetical protein
LTERSLLDKPPSAFSIQNVITSSAAKRRGQGRSDVSPIGIVPGRIAA